MNLTLLSFSIVLVTNPLKSLSVINNGLTWIALISIHLILFVLKRLQILVTIKLTQCFLNMLLHTTIFCICLYCTRFYYSLLYNNSRRSICNIITNPDLPPGIPKSTRPSNRIICLNKKPLLPWFLPDKRCLLSP